MRAKKVYEVLDFERGKDPREVLGKYTPGEIIKYDFEDMDEGSDDYPEYFIKFGNEQFPIAYHVVSSMGPEFRWIPAINFDVDEISKFDIGHIVPVEGWELEQLEDKIANSKEGQEILKFLKDEHNVLMKKHLYESMDFERGKEPKAALGLGRAGRTLELDDDQTYTDEAMIEMLKDPQDWLRQNIWLHANKGTWSMDFLMRCDEIDGDYMQGKPHPYDFVKFKGEYYEMNPQRKCTNESMDFERGIAPKEALDIGTGKLIAENLEHLKRDLSPYLIDYSLESDYLVLDVEKMDPDNEVIPIVEGYLEAWVKLEKYYKIVYDNWAEDPSGDWRYEYKIKPDFVNLFHKAYRDEMPY